jgi:hypothetical protein
MGAVDILRLKPAFNEEQAEALLFTLIKLFV